MILATLMSMEMGMESNEASNKNAQTPKWEWGDGGGIMGRLFLSSFTLHQINSSSASSSVPVFSFLLYGTTTHFFTLMAQYNTFLHWTIKHKDYMP